MDKNFGALELESGVFTWNDPKSIAISLANSVESSALSKLNPFKSAMSMLITYINYSGKNLNKNQKNILEETQYEFIFIPDSKTNKQNITYYNRRLL